MAAPSRSSVFQAMQEYNKIGNEDFLDKYAGGRQPKRLYISYENNIYPLKALWAAAHRPSIHTRDFHTAIACQGFKALGFQNIVEGLLVGLYKEGERSFREVSVLSRAAKLTAQAKDHHGSICKVCGFDFGLRYGALGAGYIECHHIEPLSGRDGRSKPTTLADVTVLCANCHRMIHRREPALTLDELRGTLIEAD